jgi:hypothetical protein
MSAKNVEVRKSKISGKGLFAKKNFKRGEKILFIEGKIVETKSPSFLSDKFMHFCFPFDKKDGTRGNAGENKLQRIESLERAVFELRGDVNALKDQLKAQP